jgi:hypothetical protein
MERQHMASVCQYVLLKSSRCKEEWDEGRRKTFVTDDPPLKARFHIPTEAQPEISNFSQSP